MAKKPRIEGDPISIRDIPEIDMTVPLEDGMVLMYNRYTEKWEPTNLNLTHLVFVE